MASKSIYVSGKCKWAHVQTPDKFGSFSIILYPNDESLTVIKEMVENPPKILNSLKKDDDGYNIKFSCPTSKLIAGKLMSFRVDLLDADGKPYHEAIGNGSDVTLRLEVYTYRKGEGRAARLKAVRVDNLVPFTREDFPQEDLKRVEGLLNQPKPNF